VLLYDGSTGAFIGVFAEGGGIDESEGLGFGPDGNLYVVSEGTDEVFRYDGVTGAFIDVFVEEGSGGLGEPTFMIFAPQAVPEPGTLALLGVGLLALAFSRHRRVG
jgi:PEP-CTERM motif